MVHLAFNFSVSNKDKTSKILQRRHTLPMPFPHIFAAGLMSYETNNTTLVKWHISSRQPSEGHLRGCFDGKKQGNATTHLLCVLFCSLWFCLCVFLCTHSSGIMASITVQQPAGESINGRKIIKPPIQPFSTPNPTHVCIGVGMVKTSPIFSGCTPGTPPSRNKKANIHKHTHPHGRKKAVKICTHGPARLEKLLS